jgi:hypothetical protein
VGGRRDDHPARLEDREPGHKTRSTFDRYNITSGEDQRKAMLAVSTVR